MKTEEFNKKLAMLTEDFIEQWIDIVDIYAEENELTPNHKLCVLLFSHLGLERKMSHRIWGIGCSFMNAIVEIGKEMKAK